MSLVAEAPDSGRGGSAGRSEGVTPSDTAGRYRRLAWLILGGGFALFCFLCAGTLWAVSRYGEHADVPNAAALQLAHGTRLAVQRAGQKSWVDVPPSATLYEGDAVRTGQDTEALITLFDKSTVRLYYGTTVKLDLMRSSRFGNQSKTVRLIQVLGDIRVATAAQIPYGAAQFHVVSDDGQITARLLSSSAALISVPAPSADNPRMTVSTEAGESAVRVGDADWLKISFGNMRRIFADNIVWKEEVAQAELIENGSFVQPADPSNRTTELASGWRLSTPRLSLAGQQIYADAVTETLDSALRWSARFARDATTPDLASVSVRQEMDRPVNFYQTLEFQVAVRVGSPSTPAGRLYPLTLRVTYDDADGQQRTWERAFYAQPALPPDYVLDPGAPALPVLASNWTNLPPAGAHWDLMTATPRPARIKAVDIIVTGYSFNASVTNLSLLAR